ADLDAVDTQRSTLHDTTLHEKRDGRAAARSDGNAACTQCVGERSPPLTHQVTLRVRLGEMPCNRPPCTPCQVGDGPIERLTHRVWRVRGDAEAQGRSG